MKKKKGKAPFIIIAIVIILALALGGLFLFPSEPEPAPPGESPAEPTLSPEIPEPTPTPLTELSIGGRAFFVWDSLIDLSSGGADFDELMEKLALLPEAHTVRLKSGDFSPEELRTLREKYSEISFEYEVKLGAGSFTGRDKVISPDTDISAEELIEALPYFADVERLVLWGCGLSAEELLAVREVCPDAAIEAEVELCGMAFATDSREIDLSGIQIEDTAPIEAALPLFPELEKVIMSDCGISDEDMDALNMRHEEVMFVWTIRFSVYTVRTDAKAFCASNVPGYVAPKLYDSQLEPIKYLRELEALDLGHMHYTDLSFLENMPKLRYLILVEANYSDISPIASLSELYYLELFNNRIEDISPLLECKNLRHLNIGYTRDYDASPLKEMTWLERLWYPGGFLDDELAAEIEAALTDTECYFVKYDGDGSTGGGWREHESYFTMRDMFNMHYMPGGTGVPEN